MAGPALALVALGLMARGQARACRFDLNDAGRFGRCPACKATVEVPRWAYLPGVQRVDVVGADVPFWSMCWLVMKWSLAAIPTAVLLAVLYGIGLAMFNSVQR